MLGVAAGCRRRASTVKSHRRWRSRLQRLGAGGLDSGETMVRTAPNILTNWRSPSACGFSLARTCISAAGQSQSLNGAPLRKAPGFLINTGR